MSEMEHWVGTITPVTDKTAEEICREEYGITKREDYYETWEDVLEDASYRDGYVIIDGTIYKTNLRVYEESEDIFEGEVNPDGSISIQAKFYNGGCSFNEALGYCVENSKE